MSIIYGYVFLLLLLDIYAIYLVLQDNLSEWKQKSLQITVILLLPLIAAVLVIIMFKNKPSSTRRYEKENFPDGVGSDGALGRHWQEGGSSLSDDGGGSND